MTSTKIEFIVQMTCEACVKAVKKSLEQVDGVKNIDIDLKSGSVVVESTISTLDLQHKLESTGRPVAIKGYEGSIAGVCILEPGAYKTQGIVRFVQATPNTCIIDGTIDGLSPGEYNIEVYEYGDISGYEHVGKVFNPEGHTGQREYGMLGKITAGRNGRAAFRLEDNILKLSDVIGRSFFVSSHVGGEKQPIAYGVIARSAGLFQNPKTICACDGTTIWDEVANSTSKSSL